MIVSEMIIGICGSPRNRATEYVLKRALDELEKSGLETTFFTVRGKNIEFCRHCDYCLRNRQCIIQDDMHSLYSLLKPAKGIVVATPIYNGGISAQLKAVMDRCRALVSADRDCFRYKVGMAIAVGGDRAGGQELGILQIVTFFLINGVIPVSGGAFGANLGAAFWSKDTLEGVKKDREGFRVLKKNLKMFAESINRNESRIEARTQ